MDFNLDATYSYNNDIHKSKIIKYKPNNLATMNTVNTKINIILNREENHLNLRDSYLEIEFVLSDDAGGVFANDANIRLVNYGMMALFSSIKLETSSGRTIEYIDHCHPNLLMYRNLLMYVLLEIRAIEIVNLKVTILLHNEVICIWWLRWVIYLVS